MVCSQIPGRRSADRVFGMGKWLVDGFAGRYICHWPTVDDIKAQRMILKDVDIQNIECDPFEVDLMYSSGTL